MNVFLMKSPPTTLTLAPSHPGPPNVRMSATLDAVLAFLKDSEQDLADEQFYLSVSCLTKLRQSLRSISASGVAGGWWVDELLVWMVSFFRCIAEGGGTLCVLPDSSRLASAAEAAVEGAGGNFCHHSQKSPHSVAQHKYATGHRRIEEKSEYAQGHDKKAGETPQPTQQSPARSSTSPLVLGFGLGFGPNPTPPLRALPKHDTVQRHQSRAPSDATTTVQSAQAAPRTHSLSVARDATSVGASGGGGRGGDTYNQKNGTQGSLPWRSSVWVSAAPSYVSNSPRAFKPPANSPPKDPAKPPPSPLHSGRPSALPVTPNIRKTKAALHSQPPTDDLVRSQKKLSVAQLRIVHWLETMGVEIVRAVRRGDEGVEADGKRRPKGVVEEDVMMSVCDGFQLCMMVERMEGVELKGVVTSEGCVNRAPKVQNLERMLAVLREKRRSMPSKWLWSANDIADRTSGILAVIRLC